MFSKSKNNTSSCFSVKRTLALYGDSDVSRAVKYCNLNNSLGGESSSDLELVSLGAGLAADHWPLVVVGGSL